MIKTEKLTGRIRNRPLKDYAGQRFGRLIALELVERRESGSPIWRFVCDCGKTKEAVVKNVAGGHVQSCGCLAREKLVARNTTHGFSHKHQSTYRSWKDMRGRCYNENDSDFSDYGGRGITVCERWSEFAEFIADMGPRPKGKTLDRIDVNGNYEPENCRWADAKTQANNKRSNHLIEYHGETRTLMQWCDKFAIDPAKVRYRIKAGWAIDRIFQQEDGRLNGKNASHRHS